MTNQPLGEPQLMNVTYGQVLNGIGTLTADLPISSSTAALAVAMTVPERTFIVPERNGPGNFQGGYLIWQRRRQMTANGPAISIVGAEIASLLHRNRLVADLGPFLATDQFTIAQALVNAMQAQPGGNVGIIVKSNTCGVLRDRTQYFAQDRTNIGTAFDQLAAVQNGFDWSIDIGGDPTVPTKTLNLSYPRRGRVAYTTGVVFVLGKNMMSYTVDEDGTQSARSVDVTGALTATGLLVSTASVTSLIDAGYPLTTDQISNGSVTVQTTLDAQALSAVKARAATPQYFQFVIDPDDIDGGLGTWTLGDDVLIDISDDLFPRNSDGTSGYYGFQRIISYAVNVPESGKETVTVTTGLINTT